MGGVAYVSSWTETSFPQKYTKSGKVQTWTRKNSAWKSSEKRFHSSSQWRLNKWSRKCCSGEAGWKLARKRYTVLINWVSLGTCHWHIIRASKEMSSGVRNISVLKTTWGNKDTSNKDRLRCSFSFLYPSYIFKKITQTTNTVYVTGWFLFPQTWSIKIN